MEIKNTLNPLDSYTRTKLSETLNKTAQRGTNTATAPLQESGDRVSLSPEAKLRTEALTSALNAPDIRQAKVAELKSRVESGTYVADNTAIASKLLQEEPGLFRP